MDGIAVLSRVIREGLSKKVTFKSTHEGDEGGAMMRSRGGRSVPQFPHLYNGVVITPAAQSCSEGWVNPCSGLTTGLAHSQRALT